MQKMNVKLRPCRGMWYAKIGWYIDSVQNECKTTIRNKPKVKANQLSNSSLEEERICELQPIGWMINSFLNDCSLFKSYPLLKRIL